MRRTKEDAAQTKDDILNAAAKIFATKGVKSTSLNDIAIGANVSRGAIYWHFKNKMDVFDALHDRLYKPLLEMIVQDLEADHPDPIQQIQDLCIYFLKDLARDEVKQQTLSLFIFRPPYQDELFSFKEKHENKRRESLELLSGYFKRAQKNGLLPDHINAEMITLSLHCYIKGIMYEFLTAPEDYDLEAKAETMVTFFFKGCHN